MGSFRSKEDDVNRISTSIYVTNFPESFTAKELFHTCKPYGHVVDSFIPFKRSKGGKRFGFVLFINVFSVDRLVNNLCTIWIDRLKIQANVARFQRTSTKVDYSHEKKDTEVKKNGSNLSGGGNKINGNSFVNVLKGKNTSSSSTIEPIPAIVLDDDCLHTKDLSLSLMGRVKEFASIPNLQNAFKSRGFSDITIRYLGELWVMLDFVNAKSRDLFCDNKDVRSWFLVLRQASDDFVTERKIVWVEIEGVPFKLWSDNSFKRIANKWGELLDVDDKEDKCYHSKRLCVLSKIHDNIFECVKIVFRGKVYWVRAKEVPGWIPELDNDTDDDDVLSDDGFINGAHDEPQVHSGGLSDIEEVPQTVFEESSGQNGKPSDDPFGIYPLLNKDNGDKPVFDNEGESSLKYPPGFTPKEISKEPDNIKDNSNGINIEVDRNRETDGIYSGQNGSVCSGRFKDSEFPRNGGSMLCFMEELIKVGHTIGYNMEGCANDLTKIIESQGETVVHR